MILECAGHTSILGHKEGSVQPQEIALDESPSHMLASFQLMDIWRLSPTSTVIWHGRQSEWFDET